MKSTNIFLALGSNVGNRLEYLKKAVSLLKEQVQISFCSSIYETAPWGYYNQPHYLNAVVKGNYMGSPLSLLKFCQDIEEMLGRTPSFLYGPREIDIDILLYGNELIEEAGLIIPHPQLLSRPFILVPLAEIHPVLRIPGTDKTLSQVVARLGTITGVKKWSSSDEFN